MKVAYAAGFSTEFQYDGFSRRTKILEKDDSNAITQTRQMIWSGFEVCEERDATNAVVRRFYGNGEQAGATLLYHTRDHLGSVREVVDSSGNLRERYDYDPYGKVQRVGIYELGGAGSGPVLQSASSRQLHGGSGNFDRSLNLRGEPTSESRGSASTTLVMNFDANVSHIAAVEVHGAVAGAETISGNQVTIPIDGMDNQRTITVRLYDVAGAAGLTDEVTVTFARFDGDVNSDGRITYLDIMECGEFVSQASGQNNCHADVNRDGSISIADIALIRSKLHLSLYSDKLFTGHFFHSASGLHLAPFRTYDAELGRWISEDPIEETDGPNLYRYVQNRPLSAYDATGLWTIQMRLNFTFFDSDWSFSVGVDGEGTVAFQRTTACGFSPSAGVTIGLTATDAPTMKDLEGTGSSVGGSINPNPATPVTIEANAVWTGPLTNYGAPGAYGGMDVGAGVGIGLPLAPQAFEGHTVTEGGVQPPNKNDASPAGCVKTIK